MANTLSLLTDDIKNYICSGILEGKTYRDILKELGLAESTFYNWLWNDYRGLRTRIMEVKKEVIIRETEDISKEIRQMDTKNENGQQNAKLLAIKQKEIEFLRETLGKDFGYTKRIEGVNLNINKTEPLDDEQKARIDKLVNGGGDALSIDNKDVIDVLPVDSDNVEAPQN